MKLLIKYLKPHKWYISLTLFIKTAGTLIELAIPSLLGTILATVDPANGGSLTEIGRAHV